MHKDRIKVTLNTKTGVDADDLLGEFAYQLNGVNQWKISPVSGGDADYELILWKGTGLDHVTTKDRFVSWANGSESIESFEVLKSWKNI